MIKGVIFDFDGTIVDSEISRLKSLNEVLKEFQFEITEDMWNINYKRLRSVEILEHIKSLKNFEYNSKQMYEKSHNIRAKFEREGVRIVPGFIIFYNFLIKNNIKVMIASGGKREHIEMVMKVDNLPKIKFLGREDYNNIKPAPDCYLKALNMMKLKSFEVIVFDDSISGMQAGISSRCRTIGINSSDDGTANLDLFMLIKDYTEIDFKRFLKY